MIVGGQPLRPLRALPGRQAVEVIDQRALPHQLVMRPLRKQRGMSRAEAQAEVVRLMERVRLPLDLLRRKPHQLLAASDIVAEPD